MPVVSQRRRPQDQLPLNPTLEEDMRGNELTIMPPRAPRLPKDANV
jgi:hypothetical protein